MIPRLSTNLFVVSRRVASRYYSVKIEEEKLVHDVQVNPVPLYRKFYDNQYRMIDNAEVLTKIVVDIDDRLAPDSVLHLPEFSDHKDKFTKLANTGKILLKRKSIDPRECYTFVINYVRYMHEILEPNNQDDGYHTRFTLGGMNSLYKLGDNTQLFFTFNPVDFRYLIDIRPACIYLNWILNLPSFSVTKDTYISGEPLMAKEDYYSIIEGNNLDLKEITYHDMGHSFVMKRMDTWLFNSINESAPTLVEEWVRNKNWYKAEYEPLKEGNRSLYNAIELYLFDIIHDRGYQFHLGILRQQLRAKKNFENFQSKLKRGTFGKTIDIPEVSDNVEGARMWLLDLTDRLVEKDNLDKINKYTDKGYVVKRYLDIESYNGIPTSITFHKDKIMVTFKCGDKKVSTSLYEIELLYSPTQREILTPDKISFINQALMNNHNTFSIDAEGNVINGPTLSDRPYNNDIGLKNIEIFKLEKLLHLLGKSSINFSISRLPVETLQDDIKLYHIFTHNLGMRPRIILPSGTYWLSEVCIESQKLKDGLKYINDDANARFVTTECLRKSYIKYSESVNPGAPSYVQLDNDLELGIVDTKNNVEIATAISSLLTRSVEDAKDIYGGYLPSDIVTRAQLEYGSPWAVSNLWGKNGNRFVMSRKIDNHTREIIASILVSHSKDLLFFFTSKYHNVQYSTIEQTVDFNVLADDGVHKWFDKFAMPPIKFYRPPTFNQIANFVVEKVDCRNQGYGRKLIESVVKYYSKQYIDITYGNYRDHVIHSQPLVCGNGFFQIADPSWYNRMTKLGFKLRLGCESFFIDPYWDPLVPIKRDGKNLSNVEFNNMFNMPKLYTDIKLPSVSPNDIHLLNRIPEVIELSNSGYAKLQYFQMYYPFNEVTFDSSLDSTNMTLPKE